MNNSREEILRRIGKASKKFAATETPPLHSPAVTSCDEDELTTRFHDGIIRSSASLSTVTDLQSLPAQVAAHLNQNQLTSSLRLCGDIFDNLDWGAIPVTTGRCSPQDSISLVQAAAGIAETGTIVSLSNIARSTLGLFLPEICLVYLRKADIVADMETLWSRLNASRLPRTVNFITGPSRTGDIEQRILIGAHGPKQLHVFLGD